jgi:hypothetical protein
MTRRKKVNSWNSVEPLTPQEQRVQDGEKPPRPHGGNQKYKDKKNWCRGKIGGRRHTGVIEYSNRWSVFYRPYSLPRCYHGGRNDHDWYHCEHHEICSNMQCRKVLEWTLGKKCPDYGHWRVEWKRGVNGPVVTDLTEESKDREGND